MTTVLKLGGSVVTEKGDPETVDRAALERAADALAGRGNIVVVHGGGSFGHHHAAKYGVSTTEGTGDPAAIRAIHGAMRRLNAAVVEALAEAAVPALPVHPMSAADRDENGDLTLPTGQVETMLEEGFVPVLHGDGVVHTGKGATVLSGDELVAVLAEALGADRVGVCSAVERTVAPLPVWTTPSPWSTGTNPSSSIVSTCPVGSVRSPFSSRSAADIG